MKSFLFLSGLARSGSTLLGSILNQHHAIYVTPTSPLLDLLNFTNQALNTVNQQYTFDFQTISTNIYCGLFQSYTQHIDKPFIVDKHRGWIKNIPVIKSVMGIDPKILCTYRPVPEIMTSFLKLMEDDCNNFIDADLRKRLMSINLKNRCLCMWNGYISEIHQTIKEGIELFPTNILPISYDDISTNTRNVLDRIEQFFELKGIAELPLTTISNTCAESKDEAWGLKNLHKIRPQIEKQSNDPRVTLGDEIFEHYSKYNFNL